MTQHPSEPAGEAGEAGEEAGEEAADHAADVEGGASERLTPGGDWTEERMRAATPRGISLDPDGKRHNDAEQTKP